MKTTSGPIKQSNWPDNIPAAPQVTASFFALTIKDFFVKLIRIRFAKEALMQGFDVRKAFYASVCFVTLGLSAWGAYTLLSALMRQTIFTETDRYYSSSATRSESRSDEDEEIGKKNRRVEIQRDMAWAIPIMIINLPIFFIWYPQVRRRDTELTS